MFPSKEVGKVFNKYFINFGFDSELNETNTALAKHYKVKGYPTLLFLNPDGSVKWETNHFGAMEPDKFARIGRIAIGKEKKTWEWYQRQYRKGNRKTQFLKDYILARMNAIKYYATEELNWELAMSYPEKKLFSEENQKFIIGQARWKNKFMDFIIENRSMMTLLNDPKMEKQLVRTLIMMAHTPEEKEAAERGVSFSFPTYFAQIKEYADIDQLRFKGDNLNYLIKLFEAKEKYNEEPPMMNFMVPMAVRQLNKIPEGLAKKCLPYIKKDGIDKDISSLSSYVKILWFCGDKKQAQELANKYGDKLIKEVEGKRKYAANIELVKTIQKGELPK